MKDSDPDNKYIWFHDYISPVDKLDNDLSESISNEFIRRPDSKHEENIGWDTPDKYSWLELERIPMGELKPLERKDSFIEIIKGYSKEQATKEAQRCVSCGLCVEVCPAHMDIPEYIQAIYDDDLEAYFKSREDELEDGGDPDEWILTKILDEK